MIRLLLAILPFLKEVIFGRDRHDRHKPPMSRFKKLVIYAVIVGSFSLNYFLGKRAVTMAIEIRDGQAAIAQMDELKQKLATQQAITERLAQILGDKVRAEMLSREAEVIEKEQALGDPPLTPKPKPRFSRMRPNIVPLPPMPPVVPRYEFRGSKIPDAYRENYTREQ